MKEVYKKRNPCLERPIIKEILLTKIHTQLSSFRVACALRILYGQKPIPREVLVAGGQHDESSILIEVYTEKSIEGENSVLRKVQAERGPY
jgi:hypothetical protein